MSDRTRRRLAVTALAPAVALAAWGVTQLAGIDLVVTRGDGTGTVGPLAVIVAAVAGALAGWLAVRVIERRSARPRRTWARLGSLGLALSVIGPNWLADGGSAVALIGLHVVTAAVVIGGLSTTLEPSGACARAPSKRLRNAGV